MRRLPAVLHLAAVLATLACFTEPAARAADGTWIPLDVGNRMSHTLTADPERSRAILFGGWDGGAAHNDAWILDLTGFTHWTPMAPSGSAPAPRLEHVAVLDPTRDRLIVFGGKDNFIFYGDLWSLDLTGSGAWSPLAAAGTAPAPMETRAVYDPVRDRLLFFGGYRPPAAVAELRELTLSGTPTWNDLSATGTPPPARYGHTMIYDPFGDRVIVYGGYTGTTFLDDVWELTLAGTPAWHQLFPTGGPPPPRYGHSAIFDSQRLRMLVFGGFHDAPDTFMNDVWALDLATPKWSQLALDQGPPPPRDFSALVYDELQDRAVLFGGNNFSGVKGDGWIIDLLTLPTAVVVSTIEPVASPDRVQLRWQVSALDRDYRVFRSAEGAVWDALGTASPDGAGSVRWVDSGVTPGAAYSYRIAYRDDGVERFSGDVRVTVPRAYGLQLAAAPLTTGRGFAVELTLPGPGDASLEVFDVSGRRLHEQAVGTLGAGRHAVDLGSTAWSPGVYWVRLTQGGALQQRRVVLLR